MRSKPRSTLVHRVQGSSRTWAWRRRSSTSARRATSWSRRSRNRNSRDARPRGPSRSRAWSVTRARTTTPAAAVLCGTTGPTAARRKSTGIGSTSSIRGTTWRPRRRARYPQVRFSPRSTRGDVADRKIKLWKRFECATFSLFKILTPFQAFSTDRDHIYLRMILRSIRRISNETSSLWIWEPKILKRRCWNRQILCICKILKSRISFYYTYNSLYVKHFSYYFLGRKLRKISIKYAKLLRKRNRSDEIEMRMWVASRLRLKIY